MSTVHANTVILSRIDIVPFLFYISQAEQVALGGRVDSIEKPETDRLTVYAPKKARAEGAPTCLDLFAGAGGMAVGFRNAGWSIVGGNDINKDAGETFRLNFEEAVFFEGPVSQLTASEILKSCKLNKGDLDCLIGGPPCQSFSYNNHQRSEKDSRARLFEHYLRIVGDLMPKMLVMENVPGILTIGDGSVIETIKARLLGLGYQTEVKVLSAEEFGTPQVRRRVFIVASRVGLAADLIPSSTHRSAAKRKKKEVAQKKGLKHIITVDMAIGDLPAIPNGGGEAVAALGKETFSEFQRAARKGVRELYNHICHKLTKVNLDRIVEVPEGGNWRDIPRELLPAGMQRANLSDHTKRYGRLSRKGIASTLLTKCDPHWGAYIHPTQDRTISVREAARLQGFPDAFRFAGDCVGKHYEQVGNAVPVPVAEAIGAVAIKHLREYQSTKAKKSQARNLAA